ncbi:GlcG/HbpS family heme-binding protein [Leptothrix discophora]|uniref:Heme-binding protein n=1 Tax=Leptothrix discophora TaxID=89 RepID=A0ABT9G1Q9_LEPDI|nr:heme-binding protein [Leptothrix discophora]MDP4300402.1 heme-binding protein [Leptothrix discophora]
MKMHHHRHCHHHHHRRVVLLLLAGFTVLSVLPQVARAAAATGTEAPPATHTVRLLTPETALSAAQAAMTSCRKAGYQVAVAVVDRGGQLQVLLRDRYAGAHTVDAAAQKAWTAASFRIPSAALATETQAGKPMSGIRAVPKVLAIGGGQVIEGGGSLLGGIGVSGAPGGEADDACAIAGIQAIADALEF